MSVTTVKAADPVKKRSYLKGRLTIFKNYLENIKSLESLTEQQTSELRLRLSKLEECFSTFDDLQSEIEIDAEDPDEQMKIRSEVEGQFYYLISQGQCVLTRIEDFNVRKRSLIKQGSESFNYEGGNSFNRSIKLPTIKLPTFDGNYSQWLEFRDTFESLIHVNESIERINKFHYLRSSLVGSAALIIQSLSFCSDNYEIAWDLLCQRYNNKRLLISNHMKSLFGIESITKESDKSLRYLIDTITKHLRGLKALKQPVEHWDTMIIHLAVIKLDNVTSRKWEEHKGTLGDVPTLDDFYKFLRDRADVLETARPSKSSVNYSKPDKVSSFVTSTQPGGNHSYNCVLCKQNHRLTDCSRFNSMSLEERNEIVWKNKLCINCLKPGHRAYNCKLSGCKICKFKHNSLLHRNKPQPLCNDINSVEVHSHDSNPLASCSPTVSAATAPTCHALERATEPVSLSSVVAKHILLSTALVNVYNKLDNNYQVARVLLDSGSQISLITEDFCKRLGLVCKRTNKPMTVLGIGNSKLQIGEVCEFIVSSLRSDFSTIVDSMVVPQITNMLPNVKVNVDELNIPDNILSDLADCKFYEPSEVDILIGADLFWELVTGQQIKLGKGLPTLQYSKLGWLVTGPVTLCKDNSVVKCNFTRSISEQIEKFWKVEEIISNDLTYSHEEEFCENHFIKNTYRTAEGRFCVTMPFHTSPEVLGDSLHKAKSRLINLEKRFKKQPSLKQPYVEFIKEYESLNHLSSVSMPDFGYYLPHHPVIKEKSETTKLRVVFNASEKTSTGFSLNDIQMVGPVIQDDLFCILLRFRQHNYVMTADIEKMFRNLLINNNQRHLQMIVWRDNENEPINYLKLNTLTYGTASAPYLSTRCLFQLADECSDSEVREIIKHDMFVDDLATGHETEEGLNRVCRTITQIFDSACFNLRKFRSNATHLLVENRLHEVQSISDLKHTTSTLGLTWSPGCDKFKFSIDVEQHTPITKRNLLSCIAKVFDPLGLLSIFVIKAKLIMQKLWLSKLEWDDPVDNNTQTMWHTFVKGINSLTCIEFPRHVICKGVKNIEIHIFSDASMGAYGTCAYVRSVDEGGQVYVNLLCAKSRVSPLKMLTIPKLELCGALLSAELGVKVGQALRCTISRYVYWTDSLVVLGWLRNNSNKPLNVFVANRVNKINKLTENSEWRYVPTGHNPADLITRGVDQLNNKVHRMWWNGPEFLCAESDWPTFDNITLNNIILPEVIHGTIITNLTIDVKLIDFKRYSKLNRVQRTLAYVLRFVNNCRLKEKESRRTCKYLTADELNESIIQLVRLSQQDSFIEEYDRLLVNKSISNKSKILSLTPFLDPISKVIRVGGRIQNSPSSYERKHPLLLDSKHPLSKLIFEDAHIRLLHAGPQLLLSAVREDYWIVNGRRLARSVPNHCILCKRFRLKTIVPIMANLPKQRLSAGTPFETAGVDLAGPYLITDRKGRGCKITKCYMCLFVCFTTKAIHLEVVSDLSTDSFLLSLRRFISRRSKPNLICCDNATNFLGASNELSKFLVTNKDDITKFCSDEGMKFSFIPPYAPNFGGLWEAGVKSAKFHMKRILGDRHLTYEELSTLFYQIEAILNSRPLFPMSSDPNDLRPLTPGHFLVGKPLIALPSPMLTNIECNRLHRYDQLEKMRQHFWSRWQHEYICELQQRNKWQGDSITLKVGEMVIIKENNLPPLKWRIGRVEHLYTGSDGVSRVADIRTAGGTVRRAVNRLCPLLEPEDESKETPSTGGGC